MGILTPTIIITPMDTTIPIIIITLTTATILIATTIHIDIPIHIGGIPIHIGAIPIFGGTPILGAIPIRIGTIPHFGAIPIPIQCILIPIWCILILIWCIPILIWYIHIDIVPMVIGAIPIHNWPVPGPPAGSRGHHGLSWSQAGAWEREEKAPNTWRRDLSNQLRSGKACPLG
jgi:hypothetical protein